MGASRPQNAKFSKFAETSIYPAAAHRESAETSDVYEAENQTQYSKD
jgi:hypothetical protein